MLILDTNKPRFQGEYAHNEGRYLAVNQKSNKITEVKDLLGVRYTGKGILKNELGIIRSA